MHARIKSFFSLNPYSSICSRLNAAWISFERLYIDPDFTPLQWCQVKQAKSPLQLSRSKRRAFALITIVTPVLCFLTLEISLRLIGYGGDISLFTKEVVAGRVYHVMNPGVKARYFSHVPFNPSTSPDYFQVPKPPNTFRIFCLGGSTTVGYPYWYNGSFSSFLRDRLKRVFPGRNIEVINVGMTATNSFTVNDMARELPVYEPDLFIVYDGHNEFYGALGVASHDSFARSRWLTRAYLRLIHFRTFRLMQNGISWAFSIFATEQPATAGSTMMEKLAKGQYIPYGSDLYSEGLSTYKKNVEELVEIATEAKVPVLLGAQVSNLRHLSPFVSQDDKSGLGKRDLMKFRFSFDQGMKHLETGNFQEAIIHFQTAIAVDSIRADGHYFLGKALDKMGRYADANREYIKARDYDMLRFRMSSEFNEVMKSADNGKRISFVDMEQTFREHSKDSIIGGELIVEHLHPNAKGYFLMARAYARSMRAHGILSSSEEWAWADTVSDQELWNERVVTELDERIAARRTEILTSGWPFVARVPTVYAVPAGDTLGQIAERVTRAEWNWSQAHNAAAEWYLMRQDWEEAKREYKVLINQLPLIDVQPYLKLARLYLHDGDLANARTTLLGSLNVSQTILAYRALGDIAMENNTPVDAIPFYEKSVVFSTTNPERIENGFLLARAHAESGQRQKATAELLNILSLQPDYQPAVALLARLNETP